MTCRPAYNEIIYIQLQLFSSAEPKNQWGGGGGGEGLVHNNLLYQAFWGFAGMIFFHELVQLKRKKVEHISEGMPEYVLIAGEKIYYFRDSIWSMGE